MDDKNLNFKIKYPVLFSIISILSYALSSVIMKILIYLTIFKNQNENKGIIITENQQLIFSMISIACCLTYVVLARCIHIYKMKSLKEMIKNIYIICLIYMVFLVFTIISFIYNKIPLKSGTEMLSGCLRIFGIALIEETLFRGICCRYLALKYGNNKKRIILSIFLNGVFFGSMHLLNLTNKIPLYAVIQQSIAAAAIGFFLGAMYLKSGNLWETITIHFVIDVVGLFGVHFTNSKETFVYLRNNKIGKLIDNIKLMRATEVKKTK